MTEKDSDLLTPTLSQDVGPAPAIYSPSVSALTAFFGGPFALIALTAINSQKLDRVERDLPALVAQFLATLLMLFLLVRAGDRSLLSFISLPDDRAMLIRTWALLLFVTSAVLHRRFQRNMSVSSTPRPNPGPAGLACVFLGSVFTQAVIRLMQP